MKTLILRCLSLVLAVLALGVVLHAADPATASTRAADIVAGHTEDGGFNVVGEIFSWGMSPLWVCSIILVPRRDFSRKTRVGLAAGS